MRGDYVRISRGPIYLNREAPINGGAHQVDESLIRSNSEVIWRAEVVSASMNERFDRVDHCIHSCDECSIIGGETCRREIESITDRNRSDECHRRRLPALMTGSPGATGGIGVARRPVSGRRSDTYASHSCEPLLRAFRAGARRRAVRSGSALLAAATGESVSCSRLRVRANCRAPGFSSCRYVGRAPMRSSGCAESLIALSRWSSPSPVRIGRQRSAVPPISCLSSTCSTERSHSCARV